MVGVLVVCRVSGERGVDGCGVFVCLWRLFLWVGEREGFGMGACVYVC